MGQSYTTLSDELSLRQVTKMVNVAGGDDRGLLSWGLAASWQETRLLVPWAEGDAREVQRRAGPPGLTAGLLLKPLGRSTRLGLAASLPTNAEAVAVNGGAALTNGDFAGFHTPWTLTLGAPHRIGASTGPAKTPSLSSLLERWPGVSRICRLQALERRTPPPKNVSSPNLHVLKGMLCLNWMPRSTASSEQPVSYDFGRAL